MGIIGPLPRPQSVIKRKPVKFHNYFNTTSITSAADCVTDETIGANYLRFEKLIQSTNLYKIAFDCPFSLFQDKLDTITMRR